MTNAQDLVWGTVAGQACELSILSPEVMYGLGLISLSA